ncbi:rhomboid-like protein [Mycobacterium sp. DL592]|uniref:rhomboid-like protein n=1 Tax=Mycobacterium sp. DL592 TaxID=2675524 RepID=UPI001FBBA5FD|nr:rhomboid-like protein [Mycobacterium sp. DL592]
MRDKLSHRVARFVGSAPVTFGWLALLAITTIAQHLLPRWHLIAVLRKDSTNLHHLASDPIRVLITSLLWLDGAAWWPYLVMFCLFLAPAERWLGHLRFVVAGLIAHIVATYVSEGFLYWQIQEAIVSPRYLNARDIGVSYFVVGIVGLLTYRVPRPWRWLYLAAAFVWFAGAVLIKPTFTPVGHLTALVVGLACYPLSHGRSHPAPQPAA